MGGERFKLSPLSRTTLLFANFGGHSMRFTRVSSILRCTFVFHHQSILLRLLVFQSVLLHCVRGFPFICVSYIVLLPKSIYHSFFADGALNRAPACHLPIQTKCNKPYLNPFHHNRTTCRARTPRLARACRAARTERPRPLVSTTATASQQRRRRWSPQKMAQHKRSTRRPPSWATTARAVACSAMR